MPTFDEVVLPGVAPLVPVLSVQAQSLLIAFAGGMAWAMFRMRLGLSR